MALKAKKDASETSRKPKTVTVKIVHVSLKYKNNVFKNTHLLKMFNIRFHWVVCLGRLSSHMRWQSDF